MPATSPFGRRLADLVRARDSIACVGIDPRLGWLPEETFDSGMRKTVEWYLANQPWCDKMRLGPQLLVHTHVAFAHAA